MKLRDVSVEIGLPGFGSLSGTWEVDKAEEMAAWELYIELVTRVPIIHLPADKGLLREALTSVHSLFETARAILRNSGPDTARRVSESEHAYSFAYVAIAVLNTTLRPLLTEWHPRLSDYESTRPAGLSALQHERSWEYAGDLRAALRDIEPVLVAYANILADAAGVHSLIIRPVTEDSV